MMRDMRQLLLFADNLLLSLSGLCFIPVEAWALAYAQSTVTGFNGLFLYDKGKQGW